MNFISCITCEFHIMHSSLCAFVSTRLPCNIHLGKKIKEKKKETKRIKMGRCGSCSVSWCVTQYTLLPKQLDFANVHCSLSLVWTEASGFCYTVIAGSSHDSSWTSCCCSVSLRSCNFGSAGLAPSCIQQFTDGLGQLKALDLGLSGS